MDPKPPWNRKYERYETRFKVEVELSDLSDVAAGETVNIGTGGMFLSIRYPLPIPGERLVFRIRFDTDSIEVLEGVGMVRWVRSQPEGDQPIGCGVEFVELSSESQATLTRLVKRLRAKEVIPSR